MENQEKILKKTKNSGEFWTSERCYIYELMNEESIEDISLAVARVETGVTTQLHSLKNIKEILIFRKGTGIVEINGIGQRVKPNDTIIVPANTSQRVTNDGQVDLEFYCLCRPRFQIASYQNLEK